MIWGARREHTCRLFSLKTVLRLMLMTRILCRTVNLLGREILVEEQGKAVV